MENCCLTQCWEPLWGVEGWEDGKRRRARAGDGWWVGEFSLSFFFLLCNNFYLLHCVFEAISRVFVFACTSVFVFFFLCGMTLITTDLPYHCTNQQKQQWQQFHWFGEQKTEEPGRPSGRSLTGSDEPLIGQLVWCEELMSKTSGVYITLPTHNITISKPLNSF